MEEAMLRKHSLLAKRYAADNAQHSDRQQEIITDVNSGGDDGRERIEVLDPLGQIQVEHTVPHVPLVKEFGRIRTDCH